MSNFANVYLGASPNDETGDPLRNAFQKINQNFANIANGTAEITIVSPVNSVAGRAGNVVLTVNDVAGAASVAYVNTAPYTIGNISNWDTNPTTISDALDELAARLRAAGF